MLSSCSVGSQNIYERSGKIDKHDIVKELRKLQNKTDSFACYWSTRNCSNGWMNCKSEVQPSRQWFKILRKMPVLRTFKMRIWSMQNWEPVLKGQGVFPIFYMFCNCRSGSIDAYANYPVDSFEYMQDMLRNSLL